LASALRNDNENLTVLDRIKSLLLGARRGSTPDPKTDGERLRMATCVLLLEIAHADRELHPMEEVVVRDVLQNRFDLEDDAVAELVRFATEQRKESVDLFQFTRLINQSFTVSDKLLLMEELWRVVYADGVLHHYEDALAGKLSGLLRLTHKQLIDAKLGVLDAMKRSTPRT
jgi:uncharacterized tellurite resistance protein B-like protein